MENRLQKRAMFTNKSLYYIELRQNVYTFYLAITLYSFLFFSLFFIIFPCLSKIMFTCIFFGLSGLIELELTL